MAGGTIEVGYQDDTVLIRIKGRGVFLSCQFLKRHINEVLDQGYHHVVVDSAACDYMDSSFLGTLTGIAIRLRKQNDRKLEMVNMTPKVLETLTTIGLNHIFELHEKKDFSSFPVSTVLPLDSVDKETLAEQMLEAHENLIRADQANVKRFQNVRKALQEEIRKKDEKGTDPSA